MLRCLAIVVYALVADALVAARRVARPPRPLAAQPNPFGDLLAGLFGVGGGGGASAGGVSAGEKLAALIGAPEGIDAASVAAACAEGVVFEDLASDTYSGPAAVAEYFAKKYPAGSRLVVERVAGNATTGGCTWRRAEALADGSAYGLRGTTYVRYDSAGLMVYAREGSEPLVKPGPATEALLKAATANQEKVEKVATYAPRSPRGAVEIADYLWNEAYPKGATPAVALDLFSDTIRYEDFNYPEPFLGKAQVKDFVEAFDIPGIDFVPLEISGGAGDACCFTWVVKVNGNDGPQGISFYGSDAAGKIDFIRDIPAAGPAPLQALAALVNPALRVFTPRRSD